MTKEFTPAERAAIQRCNPHSTWTPRLRCPPRPKQLITPIRDREGLRVWALAADRYLRAMLDCIEVEAGQAITKVANGKESSVTVSHPRLWLKLTSGIPNQERFVELTYYSGPAGLQREGGPFYAEFESATASGGPTLLLRMRWLAGMPDEPRPQRRPSPQETNDGVSNARPADPSRDGIRKRLIAQRAEMNLPDTPLYDELVSDAIHSAEQLSSIPFYQRATQMHGLAFWLEYASRSMGAIRERVESRIEGPDAPCSAPAKEVGEEKPATKSKLPPLPPDDPFFTRGFVIGQTVAGTAKPGGPRTTAPASPPAAPEAKGAGNDSVVRPSSISSAGTPSTKLKAPPLPPDDPFFTRGFVIGQTVAGTAKPKARKSAAPASTAADSSLTDVPPAPRSADRIPQKVTPETMGRAPATKSKKAKR